MKAQVELKRGHIAHAKFHLYAAQHTYMLARYHNLVIFYQQTWAVVLSLVYLIGFLVLATVPYLGISIGPIDNKVIQGGEAILLALAAGGIGGVAAVLSIAAGIQLQTDAHTAQVHWYLIKPILGAVMGLFTYLALVSGLSLVSSQITITSTYGVFVIGFLGGYLERFSTSVLNDIAGRLDRDKAPRNKH